MRPDGRGVGWHGNRCEPELREGTAVLSAELRCFVIGPIGSDGSETRRNADVLLHAVIEPCIRQFNSNIDVMRADKIPDPGNINYQVLSEMLRADLVICDMTEQNANAFYELAVRHAFGRPCVHLFKHGEKLPFDLAMMRAVPYRLDDIVGSQAALRRAVEAAMSNKFVPDNPIFDVVRELREENDLKSLFSKDFGRGRISLLAYMNILFDEFLKSKIQGEMKVSFGSVKAFVVRLSKSKKVSLREIVVREPESDMDYEEYWSDIHQIASKHGIIAQNSGRSGDQLVKGHYIIIGATLVDQKKFIDEIKEKWNKGARGNVWDYELS